MITFQHTEVVGWKAAIRGMRNPLESWEKSDCYRSRGMLINEDRYEAPGFYIGPNDLNLMKKLCTAGTDHRKFMRMIMVYVDITAPLYWWKEFDTYKIGTVANSCSTMHCIHKKEFTLDDFSHEHLAATAHNELSVIIRKLNLFRQLYVDWDSVNDNGKNAILAVLPHGQKPEKKDVWWQMIQLLPTSYNQKRTVMLNYEVLANIYKSRKDHKLTEWHEFCDWIKTLPYSELIVGTPSRKRDTFADALEEYMVNHEERPTPSPEEINELFKKVIKVDGRVKSYRVHDKTGMKKILDFYDANHKSLYAVDLYRTTLDEALAFIKEELVKLTRQNLELGA